MKTQILLFSATFLMSYLGVAVFRRWAKTAKILDIPNERSSHSTPVPRGGGVVIVGLTIGLFTVYSLWFDSFWAVVPYLIAAILLSLISWIDDLRSVSSILRFAIQFFCAGIMVYGFGYWNEIQLFGAFKLNLGILGIPLTLIWIVWLTNAYNFMDGIDGIAGIQALTAGIGWLLIGNVLNEPLISMLGGFVAFSALGFLLHNWQPAKIFMGDVGSAFLGFTFAVIPLFAANNKSKLFGVAVALVWLFLADSISTFIFRAVRGEKVWLPHRTHIYQRLVQKGFSHSFVSTLYGGLSMFIMLITIWLAYSE